MKIIKCLLIIICCLSVFVGCNKKQAVTTKDGTPIITFVCKDLNPSNPSAVKFIAAVEKGLAKNGINVKIKLVEMPQAGYASKLTLLLISGNVPDIIYFQGGGDTIMSEQDLLVDLLPYVESSKLFKKYMTPYNMKRLENFPYLIRIAPPHTQVPIIRKDWLKKLGLGVPKTVDDYYQLMKKISQSDLDGNGKKDTYGISATGNMDRLDQIFNKAFGITSTWIKEKNGDYVYSGVTEYEKKKMAFYRKLFKEKILDNEYITTRWDTYEDKLYNGQLGIGIATSGKVIDMYEDRMKKINGKDAELIVLPPPYGFAQGFKATDITKEGRGYSISTVSKHKDLAFKVLEYMLTEDGLILDNIGIEGKEYNIEDGKIVLTPKAKSWYSLFFSPPSWKPPVKTLVDSAIDSQKKAMKYYTEDINFIMPRKFSTKWDALTSLYKEYSYKIISGEYPLSKFEEFKKEWYAEGGKEITAYANEVLKERDKAEKRDLTNK